MNLWAGVDPDWVPVTCWCERRVVHTTIDEIDQGLTKPCPDDDCRQMDREARRARTAT